jgi:hypothetical protein
MSNEADVVSRAAEHNDRNPQDELARFNLLKAKLEARSSTDANVKRLLGNVSEVDEISFEILGILADYSESSPEWAVLRSITQCSDRFGMANFLAKKVYEQNLSESVMAMFTPDRNDIREKFYTRTKTAIDARSKKVVDGLTKATSKKSAASALASAASAALTGGSRTTA